MAMIPCPNVGKCGSRNHRPNSVAYRKCLEGSTRGQDKGAARNLTLPHESKRGVMDGGYQNLVKEAKKRAVYSAADSFVNRDMVIPEEFVQAYINNPDDTNDMLREKLKDDIRDDMLSKDRDILYKLGMGIDYFSDDEIDTVIDSVLEYDKSDIAGAMAKNMGPRTFSLASVYDGEEKSGAFHFANQSGDVGSDEWFDELGSRYHKLAYEYGLIDRDYDALGHNWENQRTDLEESVTSLLKNAISERGGEVNSADDLPDLSVVWKGSLHDIAPAYEDENFFTIESAYLVASYKDVGVVGEPVLVRGYRTPFAGKAEREWGAYSGIQDEATSDKAIFSPAKIDALDLRESKVSMGDYLAPRE